LDGKVDTSESQTLARAPGAPRHSFRLHTRRRARPPRTRLHHSTGEKETKAVHVKPRSRKDEGPLNVSPKRRSKQVLYLGYGTASSVLCDDPQEMYLKGGQVLRIVAHDPWLGVHTRIAETGRAGGSGEAFGCESLLAVSETTRLDSMILVPIKGTLLPVARQAHTAADTIAIASLQRSKVEEGITATRFRCVTHQTIAVFKM
jgi:hypothetical protein